MAAQLAKPLFPILLLGLAACSQEPAPLPPTPVAWVKAGLQDQSGTRTFSGAVGAGEQVEVGFDAAGRIVRMAVDVGDGFRRGQTLAWLDSRDEELAISEVRTQVASAQARRTEALANLNRAAGLVESGAISRAEYDAALSARQTIDADIARLQVNLSSAQKRLADRRILAPYSGTVVDKIASIAQNVAANEPVLEIQSVGQAREIEISVPENLIGTMREGSPVTIRFPVLPDVLGSGRISRIGSQAAARGGFPVTIQLAGMPDGVVNGMTAEVTIEIPEDQNEPELSLPGTAVLVDKGEERFVYVIDPKSSIARKRSVAIGPVSDGGVAIRKGIRSGEVVVSKGANFLRDGQQVSRLGVGARRISE